jgi:quinol monooxygenase YgiN
MSDERLVLLVEFHAAPGRSQDLRRALLDAVEPTRAEDGCLLYDLHDDADDPDHYLFYEIWRTPAAHAAHDETPHVRAILAALPDLTREPPRKARLRHLEPGRS